MKNNIAPFTLALLLIGIAAATIVEIIAVREAQIGTVGETAETNTVDIRFVVQQWNERRPFTFQGIPAPVATESGTVTTP
ncbi:hypothetical protein HY468_02610 [Candidatus Roizmanbacteria bacterium]|nr:hypothetical protein [Candidatus Roizmanbacteria bacterium]